MSLSYHTMNILLESKTKGRFKDNVGVRWIEHDEYFWPSTWKSIYILHLLVEFMGSYSAGRHYLREPLLVVAWNRSRQLSYLSTLTFYEEKNIDYLISNVRLSINFWLLSEIIKVISSQKEKVFFNLSN